MKNIVKATTSAGEPVFLNYLHQRAKKFGIPASATFEITSRCNFNCKMCYIHSSGCAGLAEKELTAKQWLDIARAARDAGVITVLITGGEPLIRNDFAEIYSGMKKLGLFVSVNTNASLITGKAAELFINDPPARLNISLYGASGDTYGALCGNNCYDAVLKNIKSLIEAGIQVRLNMSITPLNCGDLEKMLETAENLGVQSKVTTYMYPTIRRENSSAGYNPCRFSADEAAFYRVKYDLLKLGKEEFLRRANGLFDYFGANRECGDDSADGEGMRCRAGNSSCWINYKGEMNACGIFSAGSMNVLENGFDKSWQKVKEYASLIKTPSECVNCIYRKLCPMCAAVCKSETGDFGSVPEYACEFSKACEKYIRAAAERIENEIKKRSISEKNP